MSTRAERLADHFIRCAGVAAVYVDACGGIGAAFHVGTFCPTGCVMLCCVSGRQVAIATNAAARVGSASGQAAGLAAVRSAAAELRVALTPHENVVRRAFAAVGAVNQTIEQMQHSGAMKELNGDFKIARKRNPRLRYHDYLHDRKAAMLQALAAGK